MEGVAGDAELVGDLPRAVLERLQLLRDGPVEADELHLAAQVHELGAGLHHVRVVGALEVGDGGVDGLEQLALQRPESDDLVDGPADAVRDLARARPQLSDAGLQLDEPLMELLRAGDGLVELAGQRLGTCLHFCDAIRQFAGAGREEPGLGPGLTGGAAGVDKLRGDGDGGGGGGFLPAAPGGCGVEVGGGGDGRADDQGDDQQQRYDEVADGGAHVYRKYW